MAVVEFYGKKESIKERRMVWYCTECLNTIVILPDWQECKCHNRDCEGRLMTKLALIESE